MHPAVNNLIRASTRNPNDRLKILTFSTHERYQSNMCDINADFYVINNEKVKKWNTKYAEIPNNHKILNNINKISDLPNYLDFDLVLSHERFKQFDIAESISKHLHIPFASLEHVCMTDQRRNLKEKVANTNIFISEYSVKSWEFKNEYEVIHHGVNTKVFHDKNIKRENNILSVVNDWINRDYECGFSLWQEITDGMPTVVVGDTPSLSVPAKNLDDLVSKYNRSNIFLNTSIYSPLPTTLIEAMACGCCVVSTANGMIPEIINNEVNGFISNDIDELKLFLNKCLNDESLCKKIGNNARETIVKNFSLDKFTNRWNEVLQKAINKNWWENENKY